jgi:hypothetical protein
MGKGIKIPWVGNQNIVKSVVKIPWVGGQNTMGRVINIWKLSALALTYILIQQVLICIEKYRTNIPERTR